MGKTELKPERLGTCFKAVKIKYGIQLLGRTRLKKEDTQSEELLSIQKVQNILVRFLNNVNLKDHQSTESLLEKSQMLLVNRLNAPTKIREVWKSLHIDPKQNAYKKVF